MYMKVMWDLEREPLHRLIARSLDDRLIDAHAIDQDGSNVFVIGDEIYYCSDEAAKTLLCELLKRSTRSPLARHRPAKSATA